MQCYCVMGHVVLLCNGACSVTMQWGMWCYCVMGHVVLLCNGILAPAQCNRQMTT